MPAAALKIWPNASEMSGHTISSLDEGQYNQVVLKATEQRGLIENKFLGFENEYKAGSELVNSKLFISLSKIAIYLKILKKTIINNIQLFFYFL